MRTKHVFVAIIFYLYFSSFVWAIEIVSPPQGTEVHPGDTVKVVVVPSPGEEVGTVFFEWLSPKGFEDVEPPYEYTFEVGPYDIGKIAITIFALKPFNEEPKDINSVFSSNAKLHLKGVLPPTTVVKSIDAAFTGGKKTFLEIARKLNGELVVTEGTRSTDHLSVSAVYSDGVERGIASKPETKYSSANEKVAIVIPGVGTRPLVKATGPGKTSIIVQYGEHTDRVTVQVDECPYIEGKMKFGCPR